MEEQKYREKIATELSDAGVDMILWRERAGEFSTTPKDILFQEQQADKLRTTAENQLSFGEIHRGIMELEKDKAERIVLSVPEVGLTFEAPLFESKAKELIKATNKVKDLQARLNLEKSEQTFLRNKKLGLFESRKNHEDVLRKISSTITNIESGLVDATTSQKEYLNTPNQAIEMLWAGLNKINSTSKKAELLGLTEKMTVGELIEKVEMYVSSIANQELYPDEKKRHISEGYADAEKRFTIAKSEMASLVKK